MGLPSCGGVQILNRRITMRVVCLVIVGMFAAFGIAAQTSVAPADARISNVQNVKYFEMMQIPNAHVGKDLRISATLQNLITLESILTAKCDGKHIAVSVGFSDALLEGLTDEIYKRMNSAQTDRADV